MAAASIAAAVLILAGAVAWAATRIAAQLAAARADAERGRTLALMQAFAPAIAAAQSDPRALLTWEPLARRARALCPAEFAALDRAAGKRFPFTIDDLQNAHAQWTTDWLAWERAHDAEYKRRAAAAESDRAQLDAVEREKLDSYQRRYEEYVRIARALQALGS